jgi:hypothetical protein
MRGLTSMEIAIITGIILVIAVAVGWWLYTTAGAAMTGQPRLSIVSANVATNGTLRLLIVNPGPVDAQIGVIELGSAACTSITCKSGGQEVKGLVLKIGANATCTCTASGLTLAPGTTVSGRVILAGGQSFPFTAVVVPA